MVCINIRNLPFDGALGQFIPPGVAGGVRSSEFGVWTKPPYVGSYNGFPPSGSAALPFPQLSTLNFQPADVIHR
jgi:hypothetical protein